MRKLKKYIVGLGIICCCKDECNDICKAIKNGGFAVESITIVEPIEGVTSKWFVSIRTTAETKKQIKKELERCKLVTDKERYF